MAITEADKYYADQLKKLRKKHGIKQQAMAVHLSLDSQQQYSDLETGKKHFSNKIILQICSYFNISVLTFINNNKLDHTGLSFITNNESLNELNELNNYETKLLFYKKLFLESKIESTEIKLNILHNRINTIKTTKHKIYVII